MRRRWALWGLVGLAMAVGVAVADEDGIPLEQIPAAAREALLKLAGDAPIAKVERENEHGMVLYEAEWAVDGREAEASVTANGDLVEMEQEIEAKDLPPNVRAVVAKQFAGATKLEYEKVMLVVYEIEGKVDGKGKEILVLTTGKILGQKEDDDGDDDDDGEDDDGEDEEDVSLDQVPAAVKATILAEAKGATIKEVERETKNGQTVYEAEWVENGQEIEIKVAADGTLLKREIEDEDDDDDDDK